ncbi:ral GTPase-activating protein subunit alpha-2-like isoform X2 [Dendronephthya gigantea]|uniref:ral GTPase-activating protein subunit alpha-2-like isoform X2 n=1 Tax=Dendronephthya gigantea TaxID=151771 RepID=UPI00106D29BF|nr:ral GTPase-activating protein subunit alpha-2-like isoform X2 [Dendronephthya gigantea]
MFHSRKGQVDFKRVTTKFLDVKRESRQRAHALRILLDNYETHEAKVFFQRHYSEIYYICHDYFSIVEVNLRQKASKAVREDLDCVLYIFEKILLLLPELVHERWQFASIGRTMLKFLHHGNAFKLRSEGIRLLIIWLQALQENMDLSCEVIFACVVPGFPNPLDSLDTTTTSVPIHVLEDICNFVRGSDGANSSGSMTLLPLETKDGGTSSWCSPDELQILVPLINQSQAEKIPGLEDLTKVYLDRVLDYMITQICKIEWLDKSMRKRGFECLFNLFKKYYLHHVFPMWTPQTNLYATNPDDQVRELNVAVLKNTQPSGNLTKYADSVVKWFVAFLSKIKRVVKMQAGDLSSPRDTSQSMDTLGVAGSESQVSTASENSRAAAIYEDLLLGGDIILDVIYSTRENVHIVHEVFRQAFILTMDKSTVIKEVLVVYYNWLKNENRPKFMLEPDLEMISSDTDDVRAGMQGNVRLLIYHSASIFLIPNTTTSIKPKVYFCERVILMYRNIVLETSMVAKTWEQLLVVLLTVAKHVLEDKIVEPKSSTFAGRLAPILFQTLFVTWIRANLTVTVSVELWDRFLDVLSSLTHWSEVVSEWKSTMDILTSVIAGRVYSLNLKDLPLDRLSEQKHKKRRHLMASKNRPNEIDRAKVIPSPSVQESKPEVTSSSVAPVAVVPSTVTKPTEPTKNDPSASLVENQDKLTAERSEEPDTSDNVAPADAETISQGALEQGSEKGYDSDVTDSGSELSFGKTTAKALPSDTADTSLGILGVFDTWPTAGTGSSREGSLDRERGAISSIPEDEESLNDSSSKECIDVSVSQEASDENDGRGRKDARKAKQFWKDSDGGDDISSDSENVPASFSNPIHDASFDSETPVRTQMTQMMDEQHVTLEIVEPSVHSLDMDTEVSVVCGGTKEGWTPVAAVVLWTRMLGVLGNINNIENASIHAQVLNSLSEIWHLLAKIRLNQGISEDNKSTPSLPNLLPPLHYFASWLFQAAYLPQKYKQGRLIAYQLMCEMTVRRQDNPLSEDYLRHFYRCLHDGLTNSDQDIINAIMSKCDNFFGMVLPSSSLLILDFMYAATTIIESANTAYPRTEAVTILGSLLCYPNAFPNMKIYQIESATLKDQPTVTLCREIKDKLSDTLYKAAVTDPDCHARCTALCAIGIFIVEELTHNKGHNRIHVYTSLLLTSIMFKNCSVSSVAIGLVQNLSEYHEQLSNFDQDLPLKILQVLCEVIRRCVNEGSGLNSSHIVKILNPLMFCLLDWVMVISLSSLLKVQENNQTTLAQVFQALKYVVSNNSTKSDREFSISRMISREDLQIHLGQIHQDIVDSAPSSPAEFGDSGSNISVQTMERVRKTAKAVILHIVNHLNHFPLAAGAARLTSLVNENQDNPYCTEQQELTAAVFSSPNAQFFVVNDSSLISMVELPIQDVAPKDENLLCGNTTVRLIVRDMCGKHCLDISTLFGPRIDTEHSFPGVLKSIFSQEELDEILDSGQSRSLRRQSSASIQTDKIDQLLKGIGSTSPECLFYPHLSLNEPAPPPYPLNEEMEQSLIEAIQVQKEREEQFCDTALDDPRLKGKPVFPKSYQEPSNPFHLSHFLFNQLGMFGWEKRSRIDLLKKSDKLIRELKHLDNRKSRETHKIAVFYVAPGQEDKTSIMSNTSGSKEYEDFVAGLAWEVELSTHTGFMGGLDKNQSTGTTAVYYANSTVEVMFHVATRMPVSSDEGGFIKKVRHLGNDEIWIVWSEHSRDFRHGIVNAEFGDVAIAIYPLQNHLFRIQILKKGDIPYFGPLFDGAIVDRRVLPSLVRMTAVNASRAKRSLIPGMQTFYEERASCISNIVNHHKETTVFEDFAEKVFCPVPRKSEENEQVVSISTHLMRQTSGGESPAAKREGYSTLPSSSKTIAKTVSDREAISSTVSLPEGLHKVIQSENTLPAPKLGGKKLSFRRKLTPSTKEENTE